MKRSLTVLLILFASAGEVLAQTTPLRLTLDDAIARGLEASHRLEELSARQDAARAVADQREAAERPQLAAIASYTRTNHVDVFTVPRASGGVQVIYPDVPDNVRSRIDLQWPIYTGGRLQALTRAAGAEAEAAGQERDAARADLKLEITRAYLAVLTARASVDVMRQAMERTGAHLTDVRNQLSVGLVPPSDVLTIEAQHAEQRMLSIEAESLVKTMSAELKRLIGVNQDVLVEPLAGGMVGIGIARARPGDPPAPTKSAIDDVRANRPERKSLLSRIAAADARVAAASAGSRPALTVIGGYDMSRPNPRIFPIQEQWKPSWDVGVTVRWSVFDSGRVRAETAEAAANRRAIEARLRDLDAGIEVEIRQRMAELEAAAAAIEAAGSGVRAATEARRVIGERFSAGVATNTDVLTAESALLRAELDRTRALANGELAGARLMRALGR
jgi:outer membrane protein TolC